MKYNKQFEEFGSNYIQLNIFILIKDIILYPLCIYIHVNIYNNLRQGCDYCGTFGFVSVKIQLNTGVAGEVFFVPQRYRYLCLPPPLNFS